MHKIYVLDTNVLLHSPSSLDAFADNTVAIPLVVLEELDTFKKESNELGRNSRAVARRLDALRQAAWRARVPRRPARTLMDGLENPNAAGGPGTIRVYNQAAFPEVTGFNPAKADNKILGVAKGLAAECDCPVILVSKDINLRIKADSQGVEAQDFQTGKVNADELYSGLRTLELPPAEWEAFPAPGAVRPAAGEVCPNEGLLVVDSGDPGRRKMFRFGAGGALNPVEDGIAAYGIRARNPQQALALSLLLDPQVSLVTLVGGAGTGKTLLALAAAMEQARHASRYDKILVSRPIMPLGKDIGFLPGDKDNKLAFWMQPIYDNLAQILKAGGPGEGGGRFDQSVRGGRGARGNERGERGEAVGKTLDAHVAELIRQGVVSLEAITYIRGRSIPRTYMIVDEAQNLTPHEIKTIISRAGARTKVVLTGDPGQIDNPYLDSASNGLSYAVERMKDLELAGHITLRRSERSPLAAAAAERL